MKNILLSLTVCLFLQQNSIAGIVADTSVLTPAGYESVKELIVGDKVSTKKGEQTVVFSSGGNINDGTLVLINYGESSTVIVTADQPFVMFNGNMKRASALVPGKDNLLDADNNKSMVNSVKIIHFTGDVHHIATVKAEVKDGVTPDPHTILVNGIWMGDYVMQMYCSSIETNHNCGTDYHDGKPTIGH